MLDIVAVWLPLFKDAVILVAIICAGVWAVCTFYFKEIRAPRIFRKNVTRLNCNVDLSCSEGKKYPRSNLVTARVTIKNVGDVRVHVIDSPYSLKCNRMQKKAREERQAFSNKLRSCLEAEETFELVKDMSLREETTLVKGRLLNTAAMFDPGEEALGQLSFRVPAKWDGVVMTLSMFCIQDMSRVGMVYELPQDEKKEGLMHCIVRFKSKKPIGQVEKHMVKGIKYEKLDEEDTKQRAFLKGVGYFRVYSSSSLNFP